jgi:hypothetical protein
MGHHTVPQRYLKGFQAKTKPGFIWMYDKKDRTSKCLPIKQVAQVPGFYTDDVEAALNKEAEQPGNDVIDELRRGETLDKAGRRHLTYYIGTMIARVPAARARANKLVPDALNGVAADMKTAIQRAADLELIDESTKTDRLAEADAINERFQKQPPAQVTKVIETPWPFESWLVAIYNMTWRVLHTKGPSFFATCDNPVTLLNGEGHETRDCELTFPLSTDLILHCSWQGEHEFEKRPAWSQFVKECTRRTVHGAQRFIFHHENALWVLEQARNSAPELKRINWGVGWYPVS